MKQFIILIQILLIASTSAFSKKKDENTKYNETYRNQFHFSPEINKMGSPIALLEHDSTYYLYYQYNPHNLQKGYINWGLATSTDLLHWENHPCVIEQPASITDSMQQVPWWGSVVKSDNGFTAWLNRWNDGIYRTTSTNGVDFANEEKTTGTEQLAQCEPFVFWHSQSNKWIMLAYNRSTNYIHILNSTNGINWNETSTFKYNFGFPQLIEMPIDRKTDKTHWVLFSEKGTYMVCDFDGNALSIVSTVKQLDYGRNTGGTIVFNDIKNDRMISLSEIKSDQLADIASNGVLSIPVEISLHSTPESLEIRQIPLKSLSTLSNDEWLCDEKKIYPGINNNPIKRTRGTEFHIKGQITNLNSDNFGFIVRSNKSIEGTEVAYNAKRGIFTVSNTQFNYTSENKQINFELFIDRSLIEIYIDGGKYVCRTPFVPNPESDRYELFTSGGEIMLNELIISPLQSVWNK
ncbi:MAG TPA: GH32 C-terminal domain-containing protein [Prolixibacteraceae bacterium]|nr:GH32 C-terminal domain-containing protein [Prolixibacteraceae bacterium]HPR60891.1 GH32 C-terminal domain-containing protein [Prolixibacteraceae bacterium]